VFGKELNIMNRKLTAAAVAAIAAMVGAGAYAAKGSSGQEDDALAILQSRVTLTQAITAAEQHVGGKAAKAEFEQQNGKWTFDVEVVKDQKVMDVKVDAANGKVLSATEDKADHDDENDKD
jgi:uncharacterized membrane protein YkoI